MATGGRGASADLGFQALIEDRGTCAVCLDIVKDHRVLPCQHVFCLTCLMPLLRRKTIKCPTCQDCSTPKRGNLESLPKNLLLVDMLEKMCVDCRKNIHELECPHCQKWLCGDCLEPCREVVSKTKKNYLSQVASFVSGHGPYVTQVRDEQKSHEIHTETTIQQIHLYIEQLVKKLQASEKKLAAEMKFKSEVSKKAYISLIDEADKLNRQVQSCTQKLKAQDNTPSAEIFRLFEEVKDALDKDYWNNPLPDKHTFKPHRICVIESTASAGDLVVTDEVRFLDRHQASPCSVETPSQVTHKLWHVTQSTPICDVCHVDIDGHQAIMYLTSSNSISLVSIEGERLSVPIDSPEKTKVQCTASDTEGRQLLVAGADESGDTFHCTIYNSDCGRLCKPRTFPVDNWPRSSSWSPDGDIVLILAFPFLSSCSVVRLSDSGEQRWRLPIDLHICDPGHVTVCPATGRIYVSDREEGSVWQLSPEGQHRRDFSILGITRPYALCIDSRGRSLFVCGYNSKDIFLMSLEGTKPRLMIHAPGVVTCLKLHRDRYLAVGSVKGLVLYDVASILFA